MCTVSLQNIIQIFSEGNDRTTILGPRFYRQTDEIATLFYDLQRWCVFSSFSFLQMFVISLQICYKRMILRNKISKVRQYIYLGVGEGVVGPVPEHLRVHVLIERKISSLHVEAFHFMNTLSFVHVMLCFLQIIYYLIIAITVFVNRKTLLF